MERLKSTALQLGTLNRPIITEYDLAVVIFRVIKGGGKGSHPQARQRTHATRKDFSAILAGLLGQGILEPSQTLRHPGVFRLIGREQGASIEIICAADPFSYISHLSAMEWHGLTDRVPRTVFFSSPNRDQWKRAALKRMQQDVGEANLQQFLESGIPSLKRIGFKKVDRRSVNRHLSSHLGAFTAIKGKTLRVSTLGRTFLDMLRRPDLCGGIGHVLDVYHEAAHRHLKLIIDEVDQHGTKIEKVRAGYVIDEFLGLQDERVQAWMQYAQRGGSRKLDPHAPYSPQHSDRWSISINHEGALS